MNKLCIVPWSKFIIDNSDSTAVPSADATNAKLPVVELTKLLSNLRRTHIATPRKLYLVTLLMRDGNLFL